jgi:hypothetical protein
MLKDLNKTMTVFIDDYKEQSFKKCIDVFELAGRFHQASLEIDSTLLENLGSILLCFGEIEHELYYGERVPPETNEEKRDREIIEKKLQQQDEAKREAEAAGEKYVEEVKVPFIEPKKPILMLLYLISITDLKFCA